MDEAKVAENFEEAEAMLRKAEAETAAAREVTRIQDAAAPDFGDPDLKSPPPATAGPLNEELTALETSAEATRLSQEVLSATEEN